MKTALAVALILLAGCGPLTDLLSPAAALSVTIETTAKDDQGRVVVSGKTNLPNGTALLVSFKGQFNSYNGQANTAVENGAFETAFSSSATPSLPPGQYTLDVSAARVEFQTPQVARIFGSKGRNLTGPLVAEDDLGKMVEYSKTIVLGGAEGIRAQKEKRGRLVADAERLTQALEAELRKGEQLLKRNPSSRVIGEQTKRVNALSDKIVMTFKNSIPQCASMGSAASAYWSFVILGRHQNSPSWTQDKETFGKDYQEQRQNCRKVLTMPDARPPWPQQTPTPTN